VIRRHPLPSCGNREYISQWGSATSQRDEPVAAEECLAFNAPQPALEAYPNRELHLGHLAITRALPVKDRRFAGRWCFLERFGPLSFSEGKPMDVARHIGLQTVTWLLDGEVLHNDSLGSQSLLRPGGVNVMTSGSGIAHAEQTPRDHSGRLNGVQLGRRCLMQTGGWTRPSRTPRRSGNRVGGRTRQHLCR
jgi:hypothetical protein